MDIEELAKKFSTAQIDVEAEKKRTTIFESTIEAAMEDF